jgi:tetratricopeptide (TPR) repeat protein/transcriptional regulator with XRE-family HTH domain
MGENGQGFGALLRATRKSARLSQEELAERSGLNVRTIRDLERGRARWPYQDTLRRLADALELRGETRTEFIATPGRRLGPDEGSASEPAVSSEPAAAAGPVVSYDTDVNASDPASQAISPERARLLPRQLPAGMRHFTGRKAELDFLTDLQESGSPDDTDGTVAIAAIAGMAGVGKTALAVHWAHQHADRFPDGQLYVDLHGFDPGGPPVEVATAVRRFLDALAVQPERMPTDVDARLDMYRSMLAGQRMLIVLDNARDADQVRPLLPGSAGCMVVITSRSQLTDLIALDGAAPLTVGLLTTEESRELLARRLETGRLVREQPQADEVIELCGRLPLALNIAGARSDTDPGMPLSELAAGLRDAHQRLDLLSDGLGSVAVRAVFSWSYRALSEPAARLFRLLGVHPGPDFGLRGAASLASLSPSQTRRVLDELTDAHLVTEHAHGRYALHDLLRAYAAELARTHESEGEQRAAIHRVLDYYSRAAHAGALLYDSDLQPLRLPESYPGVIEEDLPDEERAIAWWQAEQDVLAAAVTYAVDAGFATHAWQLAWSVQAFPDQWRRWQEQATAGRVVLTAAEHAGDLTGQAYTHYHLGQALATGGRHTQALQHLERALSLFDQLDDPRSQADTHLAIAVVFGELHQPVMAVTQSRHALELFQAVDDQTGQANALNNLGWHQALLGQYDQAIASCERALELISATNQPFVHACTLDSIGYAYYQLGQRAEAIDRYRQSLPLYQVIGETGAQATTLDHLGDALLAVGDHADAREAWDHAVTIFDNLQHPAADEIRQKIHDLDSTSTA